MERKQIKSRIANTMIFDDRTRDNDNLLIAIMLQELYGTSDMGKIAEITNEGICETITRLRRMVQKSNPRLASSKNVSKARARKEAEFREEMVKAI